MNIAEVYEHFNNIIPRSLSCDWDNDGLMCCPDSDREVKRVLCTLDVSESAVEYAISGGFDTIISHHPLIFKPVREMNPADPTARKLIRLIQNNVAVLSFHTRLDAAVGGVNDMLCSLFGIRETMPFGIEGELVGRVGAIDNELSVKAFASQVKNALKAPAVLLADGGKPVKRVSVVGGDGKDFVYAAAACGADTFITGRASYNTMVQAREIGLNIIEAGHFYTEDIICGYFAKELAKIDTRIYAEHYSRCEIIIVSD